MCAIPDTCAIPICAQIFVSFCLVYLCKQNYLRYRVLHTSIHKCDTKIPNSVFGANSCKFTKKNNNMYTIVHKFLKRPCTLLIPNPRTYWPWRGFLPLHLTQCSTPFPSGCVQYPRSPPFLLETQIFLQSSIICTNTAHIYTKSHHNHTNLKKPPLLYST